jgi:hypothetical protein
MRLAARSTLVVGALATAAIAASAASARFDPEPASTGLPQTTATAPNVGPNPDNRVGEVGPPSVRSATGPQMPEAHRQQAAASHASAYKPSQSARYSSAGLNGYAHSPTNGAPASVHVTTHDSSFDWGDAAIGAAAGLVITLLIVSGAVVVAQRRQPKTSRAKALAG